MRLSSTPDGAILLLYKGKVGFRRSNHLRQSTGADREALDRSEQYHHVSKII